MKKKLQKAFSLLLVFSLLLSMMSVIAIVADDDCSTSVSSVPKARNSSTEPKPCEAQEVTKSRTSGDALRSGTEFFMNDRPKKRRLKPTISSPMFWRWFFLEIENKKPNAISGIAKIEISALKPRNDTIHAVTVVPIFAPMITPIACASVSKPAFTKLTTITVVAEEDWITEVTPSPVKTPLKGLEVMAVNNPRNFSPAAFCKPELIKFIP